MSNLRKEVRDLISINEKIQSALLHGDRITDDEAVLIRQCASESVGENPGTVHEVETSGSDDRCARPTRSARGITKRDERLVAPTARSQRAVPASIGPATKNATPVQTPHARTLSEPSRLRAFATGRLPKTCTILPRSSRPTGHDLGTSEHPADTRHMAPPLLIKGLNNSMWGKEAE